MHCLCEHIQKDYCYGNKWLSQVFYQFIFRRNCLFGTTKFGVEAIAINEDGTEMGLTEANFKYSLLQVPRNGVQISSLPDKYYFYPVKQSSIDKNTNLEQNIDWGGTFDPTL